MLRWVISLFFVLVAAGIIWLAFQGDAESQASALWLNLGTEMIGIVATIAIVDWLLERGRTADERRRMAWTVLHDLDHAVWVWQGGRREFEFGELLAALNGANEADAFPPFTQNLIMNIGARASNTLRNRGDLVRAHRDLKAGLEALAPLARMRDHPAALPGTSVRDCLYTAAISLGNVVKLSPTDLTSDRHLINADPEAQEFRHYGHVIARSK